jgi:hypothetical protein
MEAKNLRIGNFVKDRENKVIRIDFMEYQESGYSTKFGQRMFLGEEEVHPLTEYTDYAIPIEITEECLLKFRFQKRPEFSVYGLINEYGRFSIWLDGRFMIESQVIPKKIKYIHDLQNIYFSLTDNELPLNGL